jgi:hypothetical protein
MLATILAQQSSSTLNDGAMVLIIVAILVASAVISVIPCWILSSKGYDGSAMFGMFMLSFFCSWPIGLCVALIMPNKRMIQVPMPPRRAPPVMTRAYREQMAQAEAARNAVVPAPTRSLPPGFLLCPRCGQQANTALSACWNCKLPFQSAMVLPAQPAGQVAPAPYAAPFRTPGQSGVDNTSQADVSVGMSQFSSAPDVADVTPILPTPATRGERLIKVRCNACGKRYSGSVAQIATLKACRRCNTAPFDGVTIDS